MQRISASNSHPTNTYTVNTLGNSPDYDLAPNGGSADFPVDDHFFGAVTAQLNGFSGVTWYTYVVEAERRVAYADLGNVSGTINALSVPRGATYALLTPTLLTTVNGVVGGADGREVILLNASSGLLSLNIANQAAGAAAADRIITSGLALGASEACRLVYFGGISRWRAFRT